MARLPDGSPANGMNRMSRKPVRLALSLAALALVVSVVACSKKEGPANAPQATYVPPPLPQEPSAPWCTMPAETAAFKVAALKSQLMVAAISCNSHDKYNSFISGNRSALLSQEKVVDGYFSRHQKRGWDRARDDYITQLANAQADRAQVLGDQFCARIAPLLDEAQSPSDLVAFAASKTDTIPNAMTFNDCASQSASPAPASAEKHTTHKVTHKKK